MTETRQSWTSPLALAVLMWGAGTVVLAQSPESGSLAGKLTDLHSKALEGVALVVRNEETGAEFRATTAKNGAYRFSQLDPGEYTLEGLSPELGRGRVEHILVSADHEARVQTAMEFELPPPQPLHVIFRSIDPEPRDFVEMLPPEPLLTVPMRGRSGPPSEKPALLPFRLAATLDPEPLQSLLLSGRDLPIGSREKPGNQSGNGPGGAPPPATVTDLAPSPPHSAASVATAVTAAAPVVREANTPAGQGGAQQRLRSRCLRRRSRPRMSRNRLPLR